MVLFLCCFSHFPLCTLRYGTFGQVLEEMNWQTVSSWKNTLRLNSIKLYRIFKGGGEPFNFPQYCLKEVKVKVKKGTADSKLRLKMIDLHLSYLFGSGNPVQNPYSIFFTHS